MTTSREIYLTRHQAGRNIHRFYYLSVQPDLFGGWSLWRRWGRVGHHGGQARVDAYSTEGEALDRQSQLMADKVKKGYFRGR